MNSLKAHKLLRFRNAFIGDGLFTKESFPCSGYFLINLRIKLIRKYERIKIEDITR